MNIKHKSRLIWSAIFIAWIFDLLFWKKAPGVSFLILVVITMAGGLILSLGEGIRPAKNSWLLVIPVLFFSIMTVFREESFTSFINYLLTVVSMALLAVSYTGGKWWNYSISDYVANFFKLFLSIVSKTLMLFVGKDRRSVDANLQPTETDAAVPQKGSPTWAIVRGILLALPIVLVLAALLASADPIFNQNFQALLKIFNIDKLGEYLFRGFYILVLAYLLIGAFIHAFVSSRDEQLIGLEKPWLPPFLGWIESIIILVGIDLLFAFFVGIQFKYFFGGQTNINIDGYTYAEYARKGFSELVIVAVISLLIMQVLNTISKRQSTKQSNSFIGLSVGLVVLVSVILVSAFQRLQLYESAYGFTRLRTYPHVFMIWIGVLLAAAVVLEIVKKSRLFALAVVLSVFGFGVTLNLVNVDGFISTQNITRSAVGAELDVPYLVSLSNDAVPALAQQYDNQANPENIHQLTGAVLACKARIDQYEQQRRTYPWQSYMWSRQSARQVFANLSKDLAMYPISKDNQGRQFTMIGQTKVLCDDPNINAFTNNNSQP